MSAHMKTISNFRLNNIDLSNDYARLILALKNYAIDLKTREAAVSQDSYLETSLISGIL